MNQKTTFATTVTMLADTFRRPLSDAALEGYWLALEDLTPGEMETAARRALRESKFMPTPAELLAFAGKGGPQALTAAAADAWEAVRHARRVHSYTTGVDFGPLVNAALRNMGGWLAFCDKDDDAMVWERKKFEELFAAFSAKDAANLNGAPLAGQFGGVERVAIGGVMPPLQLPPAPNPVTAVVRELADGMAMPRTALHGAGSAGISAQLEADRLAEAAERKREREAHDAVAASKIEELRQRVGAAG